MSNWHYEKSKWIGIPRMVEVKEVIKKSEQGEGEAYHCEGSDGDLYWIKGISALRNYQANEFLAASLATAFGISIASYRLMHIDEKLYLYLPPEFQRLGYGPVFASKHAAGSTDLMESLILEVPVETRKDLLVFDYWIQNCDRTIGNPNLLWMPESRSLVVIDHNLAFNTDFNEAEFFGISASGQRAGHIFCDLKESIFRDLVTCSDYRTRIESALSVFDNSVISIPDEWNYMDLDCQYPSEIDFAGKKEILMRFHEQSFWRAK